MTLFSWQLFEFSWQYLWLALMIVFIIAEAVTVSLATIWFAIGAFVALVANWLGLNYIVQMILFVASSMLLLVFTRPIVSRYIAPKKIKTNAESLIGKQGVVIKDITEHAYGQVKTGGQVWTAKGETEAPITTGDEIIVVAIEGVKLIVKKHI